jgi:hypothetical protein
MEEQVDFTKYWLNEHHALESCYKSTIQKYPDAMAPTTPCRRVQRFSRQEVSSDYAVPVKSFSAAIPSSNNLL